MTEAKPYRHVDRIAELESAASAMLVALKDCATFVAASKEDHELAWHLSQVANAAIAQAEAAGIKCS